jgi:hypothetical protein
MTLNIHLHHELYESSIIIKGCEQRIHYHDYCSLRGVDARWNTRCMGTTSYDNSRNNGDAQESEAITLATSSAML